MDYDQVYKTLFKGFLRELFGIFHPEAAELLDFSRIRWDDKELFTDPLTGQKRLADLVAIIPFRDSALGEACVVILLEVERWHRQSFRPRMHEYYMLLRVQLGLMVFPMVVYLSGPRRVITEEEYTEGVLGKTFVRFSYQVVNLAGLLADDYLAMNNPVAAALTSRMRPSQQGKAVQKLEALRQIALSGEDEGRRELLASFVELTSALNAQETAEYTQLLAEPASEEVRKMTNPYREQGQRAERQNLLLMLLRTKFGELPQEWTTRVAGISTEGEIEQLMRRVLAANSLAEMEFSGEETPH